MLCLKDSTLGVHSGQRRRYLKSVQIEHLRWRLLVDEAIGRLAVISLFESSDAVLGCRRKSTDYAFLFASTTRFLIAAFQFRGSTVHTCLSYSCNLRRGMVFLRVHSIIVTCRMALQEIPKSYESKYIGSRGHTYALPNVLPQVAQQNGFSLVSDANQVSYLTMVFGQNQ